MPLPRSVLLIITGSVAAYKALDLIRLMRAQDITVTAVLTRSAAQFITPLAVSSLTGTQTYSDLFSLTDEIAMGHIQLSRVADRVLVAPASANIIAKMAAGISDDLATTALLATNKPVILAPAMNHQMWAHPATQRNMTQLIRDGIHLIAPTKGEMACGETGMGRMAEPAAIMDFLACTLPVSSHLQTHRENKDGNDKMLSVTTLKGRRVIVTSGPTVEAIDPVRYLGNRSSGKQGHAIAQALVNAGAHVTLISGSVTIPDPKGVQKIIHTGNAEAMREAVMESLPADIFIAAAAVADWRLATPSKQKLKKKSDEAKLTLELVPTVDILAQVSASKNRPQLVIGFAAETEKLMEHARAKRLKKGCDWVIANEVSAGRVFGAEDNTVTLITASSEESWPLSSKQAIATRLVQKIAEHFAMNAQKTALKKASDTSP